MDWPTFAPRHDASKNARHTERILAFPGVTERAPRTFDRSSPALDDHATDVLCDLSAYRRSPNTPTFAGRSLEHAVDAELDRMQAKLDTLRDDVDSYRFPGMDDGPRHAA